MPELAPGQMVASTNPRYATLGLGFVQKVTKDIVKVEFRPSIFNKPPYEIKVANIKRDELHPVTSPLERLIAGDFEEPWKFEFRQRAAHLVTCNRDGQLSDSRTDLMPHQITLAHTVVSSEKRRFLIAEEVGLGKTIEAGLIIYALAQKGLANRVLIITPAGLTIQWQEEMEEKFRLDFPVYGVDVHGRRAFNGNDYLIASLETLRLDQPRKGGKLPGHKTVLLGSKPWDVIVFDEAHRLSAKDGLKRRVDKTFSFKLAEELYNSCETLILLTGTPHRGDESQFKHLMRLVDKNVVFHSGPKKKEDVPYSQLILKNRKSKVTDAEGNPIFKDITINPVPVSLLGSGEKEFHAALEEYLREGYGYAEQKPDDKRHQAIGLVMTTFQKIAASSTAAIKHALKRRADRIKGKAKGSAQDEPVVDDERFSGEMELSEALKSTDAFTEDEWDMIQRLLSTEVTEDSKAPELWNVIDSMSKDEPEKKILIFTEYRQTQGYLMEQLAKRYGDGCTTIIRGGMGLGAKLDSMERFRDSESARFMVSTEAGGEGINLQFCHIMINYDLPWNPFRLAQRYGRLHRFGQKNVVHAFNFFYKDTIDTKIRTYLEAKTRTAAETLSKITGETVVEIEQALLGTFEEFLDYGKLYREGLAKKDEKPPQARIDEAIKKAEEAYKIGFDLLSRSVSLFNPERFKKYIQSPLKLSHVGELVTEFLKRTSKRVKNHGSMYEFLTPSVVNKAPGVQGKYTMATFDRDLALREKHLDYMAMGHPLTEAIINYCGRPEMGGFACARLIRDYRYSGLEGIHFNFLVTRRRETEKREELIFDLVPIFLTWDGDPVDEAAQVALQAWGTRSIPQKTLTVPVERFEELFRIAQSKVAEKFQSEKLLEEDVLCMNAAVTRFV
jgi:superfamily II DNA or RNA helicase